MATSVFMGRGDVVGPSSSTDGAVVLWDGTTGKLVKVGSIASIAVSSIAGTANQITASAATGAVTLSIPSTFIAPGSIAATTGVSGTTGTFTTSLISPAWIPAGATAAVTGTLTVSVDALITGSARVGTANDISWNGRMLLGSPADGVMSLRTNAGASGVRIDVATVDGTAAVLSRAGADTAIIKANKVNATGNYQHNGTDGVTTFGPAAVASITVKGGIVTAIS